jgi:S-adenosylmethionine-dependent methyltransferase
VVHAAIFADGAARTRTDYWCQRAMLMLVGDFAPGERQWIDRLGNLRNAVRQEMIRRQLAEHVVAGSTVLDVGCGQGTQMLALARLGCAVTGVEPSAELRELCRREAVQQHVTVELLDGTIQHLDDVLTDRQFDAVCAHGLLMYLPDRGRAISALAARVRAGGLLSVTFRSGHALAMRPALRGDWAGALAAFDTQHYVNELGVEARADLLPDVVDELSARDLELVEWYGVRVFNDAASPELDVPADADLSDLLDAEDQAGRRDPYRWLGSQLHVIARRTGDV